MCCLFVFCTGFFFVSLRPLGGYIRKESVAPLIKTLQAAHLITSRSDVTKQINLSSPRNFPNPKKTSVPKSPINIVPY